MLREARIFSDPGLNRLSVQFVGTDCSQRRKWSELPADQMCESVRL